MEKNFKKRKKEDVERKQQPYDGSVLRFRNHSFFRAMDTEVVVGWGSGCWEGVTTIGTQEKPRAHTVLKTLQQHLKTLVTNQARTHTGR